MVDPDFLVSILIAEVHTAKPNDLDNGTEQAAGVCDCNSPSCALTRHLRSGPGTKLLGGEDVPTSRSTPVIEASLSD